MADLLLELFSEEIPARMQADAAFALSFKMSETLHKHGIKYDASNKSFVTPRRIALRMEGLPTMQPDVSTELKGPKVGAPDAAMQGFLKKTGLAVDQLEQRDGAYFANIHQKGKPTAEVLKTLIEEILASFPWPKSMRWGSGDATWVRPLHSVLCIFDGKVIPVQFAGVTASNTTLGHRFLAPAAITITNPADYESALEKAYVTPDREKRKSNIISQAEQIFVAKGLTIKKDDALLEEVVGLVEFPVVLMGTIDADFMELPPEVLTTVMRSHQKYFSLLVIPTERSDEGSSAAKGDPSTALRYAQDDKPLSPHFLITANMKTEDGGKAITLGNERVLRARFADARFFWDLDRKKPLTDWAKGLETVTYHAKLGTVADKVARIKALARVILSEAKDLCKDSSAAPQNDMMKLVGRAAELCKADLVTGMVGEFAELQGIMGRYYALQQKEDAGVADAIRDHYKPQGPGDAVPAKPVSICVALADKLDTLVSMFAIGEKPTGSKDPFALRRAALGVIRILLENKIRLSLKALLASAPLHEIASHKAQEKLVKKTEADLKAPHKIGKYLTVNETACEDIPEDASENLVKGLFDFFIDRLKVQLKDQGIRHDVIAAVVADGDDDLVRVVERAKALTDFLGTEDGKNLLAAYKRGVNILSIEEKKDKKTYSGIIAYSASERSIEPALNKSTGALEAAINEERFKDAMNILAGLRKPVDEFFDNTLINDSDAKKREENLVILSHLRRNFNKIANFTLIEG